MTSPDKCAPVSEKPAPQVPASSPDVKKTNAPGSDNTSSKKTGSDETGWQWITATALFAAIVSFYVIAAMRSPTLYIWATYEDLFGEWVQFWCLIVAFVMAVRLAIPRWQFRWFFVVLACACFYAAMEEISWGQRVFHFSSPEYFKNKNLQGETNLHNFLTGPYATTLKVFVSYTLAAALLGYGFIYPLMLRFGWRLATWLNARGLAAPPLYACLFFIGGAILEIGPFRFNEGEVAEVLVGVGLVLMTVHYGVNHLPRLRNKSKILVPARAAVRVTYRQGIALALIVLLSAGTTTAIYASPRGKAKIDRRIRAGKKKFAARYARFEQWSIASGLYEQLLVEDAENVLLLRKLAATYKSSGDTARFNETITGTIAIDLVRHESRPGSASVNRSLARSYRMIGEDEKANAHIQKSLRICLKRVKKNPKSANAVYSLGKTYGMLGRHGAALEHISKARKLNPSSKSIRKAYYRAKKRAAGVS